MSSKTLRQPWIDHLRTLVIFLVVIQHACVTYSHVGSWYVMSANAPSAIEKVIFLEWEGHMQSFFMGLLFFVSGYFALHSIQRHGAAAFTRERLVRLGIPTVLYMLIIHPFIILVLNPWNSPHVSMRDFYANFLMSGKFLSSSGPLWFTFALLLFCLIFAGWFALRPFANVSVHNKPPSATRLLLLAVILTLTSFLIRVVQPLGTSIMNFQLCYFPQYIIAFVIGISAARNDWLLSLAQSSVARRAGWLALFLGPIALFLLLTVGDPFGNHTTYRLEGGWHIQALELATWEQFSGLGIALGLLALFYTRLNFQSRILSWLADRSFAVYFIHTPVLVALTMMLRPIENSTSPFILAALLVASGLAGSYLLADILKRTPGLRKIL